MADESSACVTSTRLPAICASPSASIRALLYRICCPVSLELSTSVSSSAVLSDEPIHMHATRLPWIKLILWIYPVTVAISQPSNRLDSHGSYSCIGVAVDCYHFAVVCRC